MKKNRFIPYGYTMRNGKMVIEKTEAEVIRRIFSAYIEGASLREIADFLTAQQVPYTEKKTEWFKGRISRILENKRTWSKTQDTEEEDDSSVTSDKTMEELFNPDNYEKVKDKENTYKQKKM